MFNVQKSSIKRLRIIACIGLILYQEKILITKRTNNKTLRRYWEFPGGKKEKKESLHSCLKREIKEETGLEISLKHRLPKIKHDYKNFSVTLYPYICNLSSVKLSQVRQFKWVSLNKLIKYKFPPANKSILKNLYKYCNLA